jgi:hypothetical protein
MFVTLACVHFRVSNSDIGIAATAAVTYDCPRGDELNPQQNATDFVLAASAHSPPASSAAAVSNPQALQPGALQSFMIKAACTAATWGAVY